MPDRTHGGIATPTRFRYPSDGFVGLGQLLEDSFPELPTLRSAESGCEFCFLLRDVLTHSHWLAWIITSTLKRNVSKEEPVLVSVRLRYQAVYACEDSPTGSTLSDTAGEEDADEEALDEEHLDEDEAGEAYEEGFGQEDDGQEDAAEMSDTSEQTGPRPPLSGQSSMDSDSDSPSPILVLSARLYIVESEQYITGFHFSVEDVRGANS